MSLKLIDYREENYQRSIEDGKLMQVLPNFEIRDEDMVIAQGHTPAEAWENAAQSLHLTTDSFNVGEHGKHLIKPNKVSLDSPTKQGKI